MDSGLAKSFKDAFPVGDMEYFQQKVAELKSKGISGGVFIGNPKTGSRLHYDLDGDRPVEYSPYIKAIFTKATDE